MKGEIKFKVLSRIKGEQSWKVVGHERINERGDWEQLRVHRDNWLLGTITDNTGDCEFKRLQFTGLVDKNGVEIYEGDRILYKSSIERGEGVIIFELGFCIQWDLSTVVSPSPSLISPLFYFGCSQEIQVIGKINA